MRKFRKKLPDKNVLLGIFSYKDGKLLYRNISYPPLKRLNGKRADFKGYRNYMIVNCRNNGKQYMAHRVIWKMFHGTEPDYIDHIDNDSSNNRIENLQECTNSFNMMKFNSLCNKGVNFVKSRNKWRARIMVNKMDIHLGMFDTKEDAMKARKEAEKKYFDL